MTSLAPHPPIEDRALPGGLVLRTARPADLDQIASLLTERGEAADAVDHRLVVDDPDAGWEACAVVVDGDRVVSTATLLDELVYLGGVPLPAGQVELVATDREYEGRGLVRALMAWAHERSAARGHVIQVMIGIPYFYRLFGYSYAIPIKATRQVVSTPPEPDGGTSGYDVRPATAADIGVMAALQDSAQAGADLRMPHSPGCWRWLVRRDGSTQWLVERAGVPVATARIGVDDGVHLDEIAAVDEAAAHVLLRHAGTLTDRGAAGTEGAEGTGLTARERPGTVAGDALAPFLGPAPTLAERYYARIPDPVALFTALRPVFAARLAASELAGAEGEAVVSLYRSHLRLRYRDGEVGPVTAGGTMQAPGSAGGAGVAPDALPALLFGAEGIEGLSRLHADVYPGPNPALMRTLFPPVRSDLLTFYLP